METEKRKRANVITSKYKSFFMLSFIVVLGLLLRLIFVDKPDGLWNDEYVSWAISVLPFGKKFFEGIDSQCHMPFYYFYLKFFGHFFGSSDLMLRLTSVLPGVVSIVSMYFVGREYKDSKLGILCASITALSSFLIYFSQEVRFYSILFLFSSLSLLFTLKLGKEQKPINFILYIVSNFLIIFTHTIGFVFVFFNLIFICAWLLKIDKKHTKSVIVTGCALVFIGLIFSSFLFKIFTTHPLSQWWGSFSFSKLMFLITDYFSPVLTNLVSAPDNFFYNFTLGFAIFALIPSLIAIAGVVRALKTRDYKTQGLMYTCFAFISVLILMSSLGKLVFITKYSIEIYPILIVVVAFGLLEFKKVLSSFLIFAFCFLNLFYIIATPNSAPKMHRAEGHKIVAELLKNAGLKDGDVILINYYPKDRFEKYFNFSKYNVVSINKCNFSQYLGADNKDDFSKLDNKHLYKELDYNVLSRLGKDNKLAVIALKDVATYSPMQIKSLIENEKEYKKVPFLFLAFSQLINETLKYCVENLQILRIEEKGSWSVITFQK